MADRHDTRTAEFHLQLAYTRTAVREFLTRLGLVRNGLAQSPDDPVLQAALDQLEAAGEDFVASAGTVAARLATSARGGVTGAEGRSSPEHPLPQALDFDIGVLNVGR